MTTPEGPYRYEPTPNDAPHCTVYYELDSHMFCVVDSDDADRAISRLNQQHSEIKRLREALTNVCRHLRG
jgi:hypothetical protein